MTSSRLLVVMAFALLVAGPAGAYTLKLDFDTDADPSTINAVSASYSAEVSIQVWPDVPGEIIERVWADMGGSCTQCGGWFNFRLTVRADIYRSGCLATGTDFGNFCLSTQNLTPTCDPQNGMAQPYGMLSTAGANVTLNGPMTLLRFNASVAELEGPFCPEGARRLCVSSPSGALSVVEFDFRSMPTAPSAWGFVKATYR